MKAIEQHFHVVLFIMLYKVILTFKSVDETLVCDHSNESYWAILSSGAVCFWQFCKMKFKIFPQFWTWFSCEWKGFKTNHSEDVVFSCSQSSAISTFPALDTGDKSNLTWLIITDPNCNAMIQSELKAKKWINKCNQRQARENARKSSRDWFLFTPDWLTKLSTFVLIRYSKLHEVFEPIKQLSKLKTQTNIIYTFDSE